MKRRFPHHIFILATIALIGSLCYSNTLTVPFFLDDGSTIITNKAIHLKELSVDGLVNAALKNLGNRPVTNVTFAINYYLGALDVRGYHVFNLIVHLTTAIVLFLWIYKTFSLPFLRSWYTEDSAYRIAAFSSLLWVVHPVQTQAVTYVAQRATSLATLFYLLSLLTYVMGRTANKHRYLWYLSSVLSAFLALGSKEIAVTLPAVMILYDAVLICGLNGEEIKRRLLFYSSVMLVLGLLAGMELYWKGLGLFTDYEVPQTFTMLERLLTEGRVVIYYLSLWLFPLPSRLSIDYYFPLSGSLTDPLTTLFSWAFILGLIVIAIAYIRKAPVLSFGILWFFLNLTLESTIIMLDLVFEHRLYLSSIGLSLLVALGIEYFIARVPLGTAIVRKYASIVAMMVLLTLFSLWTWERNWIWNDRVALWEDAVTKYPENPRGHFNLGFAYFKKSQFDKGFREVFDEALSRRPQYRSKIPYETYRTANSLYEKRKVSDALEVLFRAEKIIPDDGELQYYIGKFLMQHNMVQPAVEHLEKAARLKPDESIIHNDLGTAYLKLGYFQEGLKSLERAIQLDPQLANEYVDMADAYAKKELFDAAILLYKMALKFYPTRVDVLNNLGVIYNSKGETDLAIGVLKEVTRLNPQFAEAFNNLGISYGMAGSLEEAVKSFKEALRLNPKYTNAHRNLGKAYELMGLNVLADEHYRKAREINATSAPPRS